MKYLKQVLSTVRTESPTLYWIGLAHFVFAVACLAMSFFDDRMLMGLNVWIKPLKFCISTGIYILSLGFMTSLYPFSIRKKRIINLTVAWTLLIETFIIIYQGSRGVQSHYNQTSLVDGLLFAAMGILIAINVIIMLLFIIETARKKMHVAKSIQWSIFLAWSYVLIGSWVGGKMIGQLKHTVGAADGGPGIPFLNWSTIAGDLRIAHFFGLHAMQILPIFAFVLLRYWNTTERNKIIVVTIFGLLYASWIGFTFYQAQQGMALIKL